MFLQSLKVCFQKQQYFLGVPCLHATRPQPRYKTLLLLHKASRFGDVLLNTVKVIFEAHSRPHDPVGIAAVTCPDATTPARSRWLWRAAGHGDQQPIWSRAAAISGSEKAAGNRDQPRSQSFHAVRRRPFGLQGQLSTPEFCLIGASPTILPTGPFLGPPSGT